VETPTKKVIEAKLEMNNLDEKTFSARRIPDRVTFQWVRCQICGLYIASPYLSLDLEALYSGSDLNYTKELGNLKLSYKKLLISSATNRNLESSVFLDVGAGNGFVLEIAKEMGFGTVKGLEPSAKVVAQADIKIQQDLKVGFLSSDSFDKKSMDVISMFHVLDHLPNPGQSLRHCYELLKEGGSILIAVHNSNAFSRHLLGSRSPIFDIEHTYLFNKETLRKIAEEESFEVEFVKSYWNRYSIKYILSLLPLGRFKQRILRVVDRTLISRLSIWVPLGNIYMHGRKV
jgi:2-polyprenyl-3-methyl-5-hydroxy-6-metoxy-1,4-benzoquinol methylase